MTNKKFSILLMCLLFCHYTSLDSKRVATKYTLRKKRVLRRVQRVNADREMIREELRRQRAEREQESCCSEVDPKDVVIVAKEVVIIAIAIATFMIALFA